MITETSGTCVASDMNQPIHLRTTDQ